MIKPLHSILMGLEAWGPKPRLSYAHPGHRVYPYLLRNVPIVRVDGFHLLTLTGR